MNHELAIALHILGFLASRAGAPLTSDTLAKAYGTNPAVLRRVLSKLQRAGLVDTRRGVGGGSVLAREASKINLREVYEAVSTSSGSQRRRPGGRSEGVAVRVVAYVQDLYAGAEETMLKKLEAVTVAEMDREVRKRFSTAFYRNQRID